MAGDAEQAARCLARGRDGATGSGRGGISDSFTKRRRDAETPRDLLTQRIIAAAIEVHRALGPGLLESAYEECLCHELNLSGLHFERQVALPVSYKAVKLDCGYRMDIVVERQVVLEVKAIEALLPVHSAQLLTYLKLAMLPTGLILNFAVPVMKNGIKRLSLTR